MENLTALVEIYLANKVDLAHLFLDGGRTICMMAMASKQIISMAKDKTFKKQKFKQKDGLFMMNSSKVTNKLLMKQENISSKKMWCKRSKKSRRFLW